MIMVGNDMGLSIAVMVLTLAIGGEMPSGTSPQCCTNTKRFPARSTSRVLRWHAK